LCDAINLLEKAVRIDPKFALAHCASAQAHDLLYFLYDPTPERRALGDAAVDMALTLEPDLPEAHITCANHLYRCYRDYERARVQLAMARQGLPNDAEAIMLEALMDRRQGNFEKAIQEFNEAMTRDPRNSTPIAALADTLVSTRQFYASEQAYDRAIHVSPDQPLLRVKKAYDVTSRKTGDNTDVCSAIASLPASIADDRSVSFFRLFLALNDRDWLQAKELLEKINGGEDDGEFAYGQIPVPVDCYTILITRLQEEQFEGNSNFVEVRQELSQRAQRSPAKANLVSQLAVVDALLNNKAKAISEANGRSKCYRCPGTQWMGRVS